MFKTTTQNHARLSSPSGFPYQDLPKTLRDACLVTKPLGERYIWIDTLCIIQDDYYDLAFQIPKNAGDISRCLAHYHCKSGKQCISGIFA